MILNAALQLYGRIGHEKTSVADIAHELSMSPANVYRFFPAKQAIKEAAAAELLEEILVAARHAAGSVGPAIQRLKAVLCAVSRIHSGRFVDKKMLHDLVVTAERESWTIVVTCRDQMAAIVSQLVAAGQADGDFRDGDPMVLSRCLLAALETHSNPLLIPGAADRPTPEQLIDFCVRALGAPQATLIARPEPFRAARATASA